MAATTVPQPGIQGWMSSIRSGMVNDPNRKMFEEQVQTHGFQFFKEYLDNVLENAKQQDNAIVDLLKTPGRRKGAPKKTRAAQAAAARAQDAIKFSFEDVTTGGKENGPVNKFHEALLQAKHTDESDESNLRAPLSPKRHGSNPPESPRKAKGKGKGKGKAVKLADSRDGDENHQAGFIDLSSSPAPPPVDSKRQEPAPLPAVSKLAKELSMIAEDDELLSQAPRRVVTAQAQSPDTYDISPTRRFSLPPPVEEDEAENDDFEMEDEAPAPPSPSPPAHVPQSERYPSPPAEPELHITAASSESIVALDQREAESHVAPVSQDVSSNPVPPHLRTSGKATIAAPPVAPSGLYASSSNTNVPAAAAGVKRSSSWTAAAMKARGSTNAGAGLSNLAVAGTGHLKRKSGDMGPPIEPERVKHPKTSHGDAMEVDPSTVAFPAEEEAPTDEEPLTRMIKRMQGARQTTKSIGNAAVVAELAQAKAAAERRVADKYGLEPPSPSGERSGTSPPVSKPREEKRSSREAEKRFSVSELTTSKEGKPTRSLALPRPVDLSASTTPPDSPVVTYTAPKPPAPVFTKPAPVFVPPPASTVAETSTERSGLLGEFSFKLPASSAFTRPQLGLGMAPLAKLSPRSPRADSGASTQESEPVDPVFDSQPLSRQVSSSTQGTSQSTSQSQMQELKYTGDYVDYNMPLANDEDDTWNLDEKMAATTQTWTPYTTGGNTDTWSSGPSDTQTQPAGAFTHPFANADGSTWNDWPTDSTDSTRIRSSEATPAEDEEEFTEANEIPGAYVDDVTEDVADVGPSGGIRLVQTKSADSIRSESQLSMASSSDESQHGIMGQASKFVSSIFGGGPGSTKKKDGPIKSVQLAAAAKVAAAKKQQEEEARKVARQKDMEARRQQAIQRKVEEDRQRAEEDERKVREAREEVERRRKEREEAAAKREEAAAKRAKAAAEKKTSDDEANKKKIVEKPKSAMKKPAPVSKIVKPTAATAAKPKPLSKQASVSSLNDKSMKFGPPKGKAKAQAGADSDMETKQPKAGPSSFKTPAPAPPPKPETPEEWIDLPEPNSEYSNSDDEDKGKDYDVADWAQSPVLFNQLREQETMDPDDIFGPIRPLRMEEMFTGRARQSRFRARSSSANWAHGDGLTEAEAREYARRMGFR